MKHMALSAGLLAVAFTAGAEPRFDAVSFVQGADGEVTVSYTLSDEAAIVTFEAFAGDDPLPGEAMRDVAFGSDCWKAVEPGDRTIRWRPHANLASNGVPVSVRVSAWTLDNPPPVMVVDLLSGTAAADRVRYYPSLDHLPGGLLDNAVYRTSKLVFKKVQGVGVSWTMGAPTTLSGVPECEYAFDATLSRNYYLGVFQFTQGQYRHFSSSFTAGFSVNRAMRPLESIAFNELRCNALGRKSYAGSGAFGDAPYAGSLLDLIRSRTGVAVDLPTDAEWEFACRAGGDGSRWDNGAPISKAISDDVNMNGRHKFNGGYIGGTEVPRQAEADVDNATAAVGSYAPNGWGFYDMHGNVFEYCLDWYEADPSGYGGAVNINPDDPTKTRSGAAGETRVRRGGAWHVGTWDSRPTNRIGCNPAEGGGMWGFRLLVPAGTSVSGDPAAARSSDPAALTSVGGFDDSSAGPLEARIFTWLESVAIGIKADPVSGLAIIFR